MLENNSRVQRSLLHLCVSSGIEVLSEEDLVDSGVS